MPKNRWIVFAGMGFEIAGLIIGAVWIGNKLDIIWGTKGLFVISFLVGSLIGWLVQIIYLVKKMEKN